MTTAGIVLRRTRVASPPSRDDPAPERRRGRFAPERCPRVALVVSLLVASGAARAEESGLACAASTIGDYAKAKIALYQGRTLFSSPSVEFTLRARRLKEDYCLRYTRCLFDDPNGFAFTQNFANCVREKE